VARRKSIWMVQYLRARRAASDYLNPRYVRDLERRMMAFYRRQHFSEKKRKQA